MEMGDGGGEENLARHLLFDYFVYNKYYVINTFLQ
jgi:hypothetical protein